MSPPLPSPERLFDRTWRPGFAFRPGVARFRRIALWTFFILLLLIIAAYQYLTDGTRVRRLAEETLGQILGGPVVVDRATLSIFEGLRLDGVHFYVGDPKLPDSLLFSAQSFLIEYRPLALLARKLDVTRIIAMQPRVHLTDNADTDKQNYAALLRARNANTITHNKSAAPLVVPEVVLRDAQIEYTHIHGGQVDKRSAVAIEGLLQPLPGTSDFKFALQSRGPSADIGPMIQGRLFGNGELRASLQNFKFGPDVVAMLPPEVQRWTEAHGLDGRLSIPTLNYSPPRDRSGKPGYAVEIILEGVKLTVNPREWMGGEEIARLEDVRRATDALRRAGLDRGRFVDQLEPLLEPAPIQLRDVRGRFNFPGDQTIHIDDLTGRLEDIPFNIHGHMDGFSPGAPASLHVESSRTDSFEIPAAPRYLSALPPAVREIYDRFKPRGICRFEVDLDRAVANARPHVTGKVEIINGNFTFDRFPYPLQQTTGDIILKYDQSTNEESLSLEHIRGHGAPDGPNAHSYVEVNGMIGPFGPDARCDVIVTGKNVAADKELMGAFPPLTRRALTLFDAPGKGEFPKLDGDFTCNVQRDAGMISHWTVSTSIHLDHAAGMLVGFPYPMKDLTGDLRIFDNRIELENLAMIRGDSTLRIDGTIGWPTSEQLASGAPPALKPDLHVVAHNVPIDRDLLNALPEGRRNWLTKIGAGGKFDLDGTIKIGRDPQTPDELALDLNLSLRDGTLAPGDATFAITDVQGALQLTERGLTLSNVRGKRGDTEMTASGQISWPDDKPTAVLQAQAVNLALDASLRSLLPPSGQAAWDQAGATGVVDASLNYSGEVSSAAPATSQAATTQPSSAGGAFEILITPRQLTATPTAVPYTLSSVAGSVRILPDRIELKDMTARHGAANIRFAGTGQMRDASSWNFTLSADHVPLDDDFKKAVPASMSDLIKSIGLRGMLEFEFPHLVLTTPAGAKNPDVDFALNLRTTDAALDVGVPMENVKGIVELKGTSHDDRLATLLGAVQLDSFDLAGRPMTNMRCELHKPAERDQITLSNIQAGIANGSIAGQIDYAWADNVPSRYAMNLILRNAAVKDLAGESEPDLTGQMSASLALEGAVNNPGSRRGRGDVTVIGQQLYKIPLMLGLLQITNLALPSTSPFTQASARYSIEGQRVTFEQIELQSNEMMMSGSGVLDFFAKQVKLDFVTNSANWPKVPLLGDILEGARHELLQIHVRGTLEEPKVSARSFNTFSTTVDQVFRGEDQPPTTQKAKRKW